MVKTALVTGVARGIGKAICERLLSDGYVVHGTYFQSKEQAEDLQSQYGADRLLLHGPFDFRRTEDVERLVKDLDGTRLNTIVSNAGMFSENDDFYTFDLNDFQEVMNCNFYAALILCTGLRENIEPNGAIIILSSNDAFPGAFASISYTVSKAALISLTHCLAVNFGPLGVRVNAVAPGAINTDMNTPEQEFDAPLFTPLGRIAQPQEVAGVVSFLCSPDASFVTGDIVTIDGGYTNTSVLLLNEASRLRAGGD